MQQLWLLPVFVLCILCTDNNKRQLLSDVTNTDINVDKLERRVLFKDEEIESVMNDCESFPTILTDVEQIDLFVSTFQFTEFLGQFKNARDRFETGHYYFSFEMFNIYGYTKQRRVKEIFVAKYLNQIPNINVPKYTKCYKDVQYTSEDQGIVLQYEDIEDSIGTQHEQYTNIMKFEKLYYYFNLSKKQRLNNFLELFQSLALIHKENITLRNISPVNIKLNVRLQELQENSEKLKEVKLYFSNFQYAYFKQLNNEAIYFPDSTYVHPETRIQEDYETNPKNDVYSLCAVYFLIEMYNPKLILERIDVDSDYIPEVIGKENLSPYDVFGDQIGTSEKQTRLSNAINAQRSRIKNDVLKNLKQNNNIDQQVLDAISLKVENELETRTNKLLEVCQNDCDCVIYSGIQYSLYRTPSAELIANTLKKCIDQMDSGKIVLI